MAQLNTAFLRLLSQSPELQGKINQYLESAMPQQQQKDPKIANSYIQRGGKDPFIIAALAGDTPASHEQAATASYQNVLDRMLTGETIRPTGSFIRSKAGKMYDYAGNEIDDSMTRTGTGDAERMEAANALQRASGRGAIEPTQENIDALRMRNNPNYKPASESKGDAYVAAERIMKENPNMTFTEAYKTAKRETVSEAGEKADARGKAKVGVEAETSRIKLFTDYKEQGRRAYDMIANLETAERAMVDVQTGALAPFAERAKAYGGYLGLDTTGLSEAQTIKAVQNQLALQMRNPKSGGGLTGNTSDRDIKFLLDSVMGLEKDPQANKVIISALKKLELRKSKVAEMITDYEAQGNLPDAKLEQNINNYLRNTPLFPELFKKGDTRIIKTGSNTFKKKIVSIGRENGEVKAFKYDDGTMEIFE